MHHCSKRRKTEFYWNRFQDLCVPHHIACNPSCLWIPFFPCLALCLFYSCEWNGVFYPVLPGWGSQELIVNPKVLSLLRLTCCYHTSRSQPHTMHAPAWTPKETCAAARRRCKFSFCVWAVEHHQTAPRPICQQVHSAQSAKLLCSHLWLRKSGQRQKEEVKEFVIKGLFPPLSVPNYH